MCGWLHVVFALPTKNHRIFFRSNLSGIFVEIEPHARAVNTLLIGHTKKKSSRREIGYTHIFLSCLFIQIVCVYILRLCPQRHEGVSISRQRAMFETCDDTLHCIAVLLFIYSFGLRLVGWCWSVFAVATEPLRTHCSVYMTNRNVLCIRRLVFATTYDDKMCVE